MEKKLYKSSTDKVVDGVCAGFASYFGLDPTLIRIAYAIFTFFSCGTGILLYIICLILMPSKPKEM